jgi:hypothetical protein
MGFGQATNLAVLRPLQQLLHPHNTDDYLMSIFGRATPLMAASTRQLQDLPDEIMLEIAWHLSLSTQNKDLMNLVLTSRKPRQVAQEVMLQSPVVYP